MDKWSNSLMGAQIENDFLYDILFHPEYDVHYVEGQILGGWFYH